MRARATLAPVLLALAGCGNDERLVAGSCSEQSEIPLERRCERLTDACSPAGGPAPGLSPPTTVVPDPERMPPEVISQAAHNNLDITWYRGRLYFAFRTGPFHFAHADVALYVVSTLDQKTFRFETKFWLEKDLREPRFLTVGDRLFLYFARLGATPLTFVPEAMMMSERVGCVWSEPEEISPVGKPGFIPWRGRQIDGKSYLIGYVGGENIYGNEQSALEVHWLETSDGRSFEPVAPGKSAVLVGGASETDFAFLHDGSVIAVARNEAGDADGWGSKICTATPSAIGDWSCVSDRKKYDSPLLFAHGSEIYLIARRQVANDGNFDLDLDDLSPSEQSTKYQNVYWNTPKRCALWKVDPRTRSVSHLIDLPSNGDTCFASEVQLSARERLVYDYTSPLDPPDLAWNDGQFGPTYIYRTTLLLP